MPERFRRSLQTLTDLGHFTRRKIHALLLYIHTHVRTDSFVDKDLQLPPHLLDSVVEVGELTRDKGYVRVLSHMRFGPRTQPMCSMPSGRPTHECLRCSHTET